MTFTVPTNVPMAVSDHRLQRSLRVHCHLRTNGIPLKLVHTLPPESDARTVAVALRYIDLISARVFSVAPA